MVKKTDRILCVAILAALAGFASGCAVPQKIGDSGIVVEQEATIIEATVIDACGAKEEGEKISRTRKFISSLNTLAWPSEWRIWPDDSTNDRFFYLYDELNADDSVVSFVHTLQGNSSISNTSIGLAIHSAAFTLETKIDQAMLAEFSELISQLDAEEYRQFRELLATATSSRRVPARLAAEVRASRAIDNANAEYIWAGLFYASIPQIGNLIPMVKGTKNQMSPTE